MDRDFLVKFGRCPSSGAALSWTPNGDIASAAGDTYLVQDGVARFAPELSGAQATTQEFYDTFGWQPDAQGKLGDTRTFLDPRRTPRNFARWCMQRIGRRYFAKGGDNILDAGSGPLVDDGVRAFGDHFKRYVCTDLSLEALRGAQAKLGDRGVYLQADITKLPIQDNTMDAVTCNHVIYQLPLDLQAAAFEELYRVLKPGGVAVVIYWWQDANLAWRLERLARLLRMRGPGETAGDPIPDLPHNTRTRTWFEEQPWSFAYDYDIYRSAPELFMRRYIPGDWRGQLFLGGLRILQMIAPTYCGRNGQMPAIVLRKPV